MDALIYDAVRTPRCKAKPEGSLATVSPQALVPVLFERKYNPDMTRVNVSGGHLAKGHPIGATGADSAMLIERLS